MWVFGYGSLMWDFHFPHSDVLVGHIKAFDRRFYQYCTNHRGTPEQPGRVATLIPSENPEAKVYGLAYNIDKEYEEIAMQALDQREHGGYVRTPMLFYPKEDEENPFEVLVYVADQENANFTGPSTIDQIVDDVLRGSGPSGTNIEYVEYLAGTVRSIAPDAQDDHLFEIVNGLQKFLIDTETKQLQTDANRAG